MSVAALKSSLLFLHQDLTRLRPNSPISSHCSLTTQTRSFVAQHEVILYRSPRCLGGFVAAIRRARGTESRPICSQLPHDVWTQSG